MDELVKRLRELHPEEFGDAWDFAFACQQAMHEAADAIEGLSKPRWIPVTERLPKLHDAEYLDEATGELVRYKESMPVLIWLAKGGFMDIGIYEKSDAVDDFCYQGIPQTVTYWMPLPDVPEEGE